MTFALLPEMILVFTALAVLGLGLESRTAVRGILAAVAVSGLVAACAAILGLPVVGEFWRGMISLDSTAQVFRVVILALALVAVIFTADTFPARHFAEGVALILFSTVGMLLLCATSNLLMIFLALELTSIPLYVLAGFQKSERSSAEAALKYFLIGSVSAAFLLYGLSLIYGVSGSLDLRTISAAKADPLLTLGIVLTLAGFAFKVAAVPFQLWAPDVYEGAPTPTAALIASGSKVAGIFILVKLLDSGFGHWAGSAGWGEFLPGWAPVLALMAAGSMVLGNLSALVQSNVKRLLAYSAIAHGGYLLLGLASARAESLAAVLFYVIVYALTTAGAFGVVSIVESRRGGSRLEDFNGLVKSSPVLALCLLVFLLSLAGIPPLAGFFGKFFLFSEALRNPSLLWLVVLAIALNAVSLYYYLIVLKHAFVLPSSEVGATSGARASSAMVLVLAVIVLGLGVAPNLLLNRLSPRTPTVVAVAPEH